MPIGPDGLTNSAPLGLFRAKLILGRRNRARRLHLSLLVQTFPSAESANLSEPEFVEAAAYAKMVQPEPAPEHKLPAYRSAEIAGGTPDNFYEQKSRRILAGQLSQVINTEGPIADTVLFRKVARAWGLARTGKRIEEQLRSLLPEMVVKTVEGETTFYWPELSQPTQWQGFRIANLADDSKRQLNEICLEELANLANFILSEHGATSVSELARSICRLQRIARTSLDAEARVIDALKVGRCKESVKVVDGTVRLSS